MIHEKSGRDIFISNRVEIFFSTCSTVRDIWIMVRFIIKVTIEVRGNARPGKGFNSEQAKSSSFDTKSKHLIGSCKIFVRH